MIIESKIHESTRFDDWAVRSRKWELESKKLSRRRKLRERQPEPLVLCGHGVSLRIENGALVIREGFTHYPQNQVIHRFFRGDLNLPPRILLLDGSGTLSFDVMSWMTEQDVALIRITWDGQTSVLAGGSSLAQAPTRASLQENLRADQYARVNRLIS
jgi:CRISPR-associated protein Cas1